MVLGNFALTNSGLERREHRQAALGLFTVCIPPLVCVYFQTDCQSVHYWWGFFSDSFCRLNGYASRWRRGTLYDWVIDWFIHSFNWFVQNTDSIRNQTSDCKFGNSAIILNLLNHNNITNTICVKTSMSEFTVLQKYLNTTGEILKGSSTVHFTIPWGHGGGAMNGCEANATDVVNHMTMTTRWM